jgi:two-component system cell cycle sensor histidine kinase PleC
MAFEAIRQSLHEYRRPAGIWELFSLDSGQGAKTVKARLAQLPFKPLARKVVLGAGLAGLAALTFQNLSSWRLGAQADALCLMMIGLALASEVLNGERGATQASAASGDSQVQSRALHAAGAAGLRWSLVDGVLNWDENAEGVFGEGAVPATFRALRTRLHPDDSLYNSISEALKTSSSDVCLNLRLKDGEEGWKNYSLQGTISCGDKGACPVLEAVLIAQHAPVQAGAPAQGSQPRLSPIVEALPMSFAIWDPQKRLQFCNRKFRQLYRIPPGAALPTTPFDELQIQAKEHIIQAPAAASSAPGRFQLREKQLRDGTWLQIYEYWTGDGTMVTVGADITAPKISEQRISERESELRSTVASYEQSRRQLEIQTRQLRDLAQSYNEEKIRAESANRAKSEFLANVSHELRTPLNAIIGFSEMMSDGVLGPIGNKKYETYARDISESGRYLLEMINDILDMSKIEAGRLTLSPEWVALGPLFDECLRVVHPAALDRKVQLLQARNANIPVFGDKRALKQILINLLSNAVKFTLPGGKVLLRAYRYKGTVRIAITDTGVGIAKHEIGRLGRPFEQVQNQLTKGHKGTGLGLAITRSLAELHGGKVEIKSKAGEGTTVTCILPGHEEKAIRREAA